jgi:uncharacterized membrane protein
MFIVRFVIYIGLFLCVLGLNSCNVSSEDDEFELMNKRVQEALRKKDIYLKIKEDTLLYLKNYYRSHQDIMSYEEQYALVKRLYEEYHLYSFDFAYNCAVRLSDIAREMDSPARLVESKVAIGYVLARGGFFKEAIDTLSAIEIERGILPHSVLADYYIRFGRAYHDLADYTNDRTFSPLYNEKGNCLLSKALFYVSDSLSIHYIQGKIDLKSGKITQAKEHYMKALKYCEQRDKEWLSILYSTIAFINHKLKQDDEAMAYYVKAVENDIEGSIMETVALRGLANLIFYNKNDFNVASEYINIALNDAMFYGTRHRMNVIGTLLPVFVGKKLDTVEIRMRTFFTSFLFCLILVILLAVAVGYVFWQMKKVRVSKQLLNDANIKLQKINTALHEVNSIKDCYLGHYLELDFELINRLESFALLAQQKMDQKQYAAVNLLIRNLVKEYNRKLMFTDFDYTFLSLFPSFVYEFNALLLPEEQIILEKDHVLNSTLRIYALVRLGISDTEQIAKILNYSFNTVYNYRIRMRNKAKDPKSFEEQVLKIAQ